MPQTWSGTPSGFVEVSRPMVKVLFVASCLLSIVSWYTTQQGMALYLSPWLALAASLGVQSALVLVAWLIGFTKSSRILLIAVYGITAIVSIAFSYVSLYTWFSARERPAAIERRLYDALSDATAKTEQVLASAAGEGRKHVLALEEMLVAEKAHGYISRAEDADPYLAAIRHAVAREAETYSAAYPEGVGEGVRYTAFDRYAKLARQSVERIEEAGRGLAEFRAQNRPLDPTEKQLRAFHQAYDPVPWTEVESALHAGKFERPAVPLYTDFVDRSVSGQEDLLIAFRELLTAPDGRHVLAFFLAAFIDLIVFLLAYASGPYFFGAPEQRWAAGAAALDSVDRLTFTREFLRKLTPDAQGMARAGAETLSPGEQQFCLLLVAKGLASSAEEDGRSFYRLDPSVQEELLEAVAAERPPLHASTQRAPMRA